MQFVKLNFMRMALAFMTMGTLWACSERKGILTITNPGTVNWQKQVIEIPWDSVLAALPGVTPKDLVVTDVDNVAVPFQVTRGGGDKPVALLVQSSLAAGALQQLVVKIGEPGTFEPQTFARQVPERYDDFAWENDKIAFRAYGKALEATNENAWGIDVWSKRTDALVIDKWYAGNDYHKDHGEGLDYYKVGFTLGGGSVAVMHADTISYPKNYITSEVLENGPLRTIFRLKHDSWQAGTATVGMERLMSIDAGSQFFTNRVTFTLQGADSIGAVAGLRKNEGADSVLLDMENGIMGYWNPVDTAHGTIGVAVLVKNMAATQKVALGHLLLTSTVRNGDIFTYHAGAAWDRAGAITNAAEWFAHLRQVQQTAAPIIKVN